MLPTPTPPPLGDYILLCEGGGDVAFFNHLIEARGLPGFSVVSPRFYVDPGGVSGYESRLRALKLEDGFDTAKGLLVVGDNYGDPKSSFGNVRSQIEAAGDFSVPNKTLTVAKGRQLYPSVAIMMLPWDKEQGQLETLCLVSMRANYGDLATCVDQFCSCSGANKWKRGKLERMMTRAMLTANCEQDPNTSIQHAWSRTVDLIPLTHTCFDQIATFLAGFPTLIDTA